MTVAVAVVDLLEDGIAVVLHRLDATCVAASVGTACSPCVVITGMVEVGPQPWRWCCCPRMPVLP